MKKKYIYNEKKNGAEIWKSYYPNRIVGEWIVLHNCIARKA